MTPNFNLMAEPLDEGLVKVFLRISRGKESADVTILSKVPENLWREVKNGLEDQSISYIKEIQNTPLYNNNKDRLSVIYYNTLLCKISTMLEHTTSNMLNRSFDIKTLVGSCSAQTKLNDIAIESNNEHYSLEDVLSRIESSTTNIMGSYTKRLYRYLRDRIEEGTEPGKSLKTSINVHNMRKVLGVGTKYDSVTDLDRRVIYKVCEIINSDGDIYILNVNKDRKVNASKYTITYELKLYDKTYPKFSLTYTKSPNRKVPSSLSYTSAANIRKSGRMTFKAKDLPEKLAYISERRAFIYEVDLDIWNHDIIPGSNVYFLVKDNKVVYVGKSNNELHKRIAKHLSSKDFNRLLFIPGPALDSKLKVLEAYFIHKLIPAENKTLNLLFEERIVMGDPMLQKYIE